MYTFLSNIRFDYQRSVLAFPLAWFFVDPFDTLCYHPQGCNQLFVFHDLFKGWLAISWLMV